MTDKSNLPSTVEDVVFEDYAVGVVPADGTSLLGRFLRVERSSIGFDFGAGEVFPLIVIFEAVDGTGATRDGDVFDLEVGQEYALWLIHSTLYDAFTTKRPKPQELFAVKGHGKKLKRGKEDPEEIGATYYGYSVAFPERPKPKDLTWDDVLPVAKEVKKTAAKKVEQYSEPPF